MTRKLPKKKSKLSHLFILSFIGITLVIGAIFVIKGFVKRKWDGETRFTVITFTPKLKIISFDPKSKQGIILTVPSDLQIESIMGRGKWRAEIISQAGEMKWAADSVADYLGISYTALENELEWWDRLMWSTKSKNVIWKEIDLDQTSYVVKQKLPDGLEVLTLASGWDLKSREWFYDQKIASQVLGVEIINTTSTSGLGAGAARVVESMGFKVRNLSTVAEQSEECRVKSEERLKNDIAVQKLLRVFGCRWEESYTQDVILTLGRDYLRWKFGPTQ